MPYTLGERVYGIRNVGTGAEFPQQDLSFAPLADTQSQLQGMGKGTLLLLGLGVAGLLWWVVAQMRKPASSGLSGDYTDLVADKAQEAVRGYRATAQDFHEKANLVEQAWKEWDFDTLVLLGVVDKSLAGKAGKEMAEEFE